MKPTPMTDYKTITATRVLPPPENKPHAYAARVQALIDKGHTPITAMHILERKEQPGAGRLPPSMDPRNNGGRGKARPKHEVSLTTRCLAALTTEWQSVTDAMAASIGSKRENIGAALRDLRDLGRVEHMRGSGNTRALWRVK